MKKGASRWIFARPVELEVIRRERECGYDYAEFNRRLPPSKEFLDEEVRMRNLLRWLLQSEDRVREH